MQNATAAEIVYGKCTDQPKNMQASEKNITMYNECTEKQKNHAGFREDTTEW